MIIKKSVHQLFNLFISASKNYSETINLFDKLKLLITKISKDFKLNLDTDPDVKSVFEQFFHSNLQSNIFPDVSSVSNSNRINDIYIKIIEYFGYFKEIYGTMEKYISTERRTFYKD